MCSCGEASGRGNALSATGYLSGVSKTGGGVSVEVGWPLFFPLLPSSVSLSLSLILLSVLLLLFFFVLLLFSLY